MSIGKRFRILKVTAAMMVLGLAGSIASAIFNQSALNNAQQVRYQSMLLANELRMSSEDLTRLARTFVVTGDSQYERMYWDILAVRNGEKPRADGRTASLTTLMKEQGFTDAEFAKLKEAEANSNDLVNTETIAMNEIKKNGNLEMARRIMHDQRYHDNKVKIVKPIDEFGVLLDRRTEQKVAMHVRTGTILFTLIGFLALATATSIFFIVASVNGVLSGIVVKLKSATEGAAQSTGELVGTSQNLSSVSTEQASTIQETVATLTEINSMVSKSRENADRAKDIAKSSKETAESGKDAVQEMITAISEIDTSNGDIAKQVEASNAKLAEIMQIISEIGNKTKVINDIVFQTKLLSFNASVEAARAGEHGKGFAVVAEEVGNLAQMSGNSAKEISTMLESGIQKVEGIIQDTTQKIQHLMTQARAKVSRGTEVAKRCDGALTQVVNIVGNVNGAMEEIATAANEQAKGVNEITNAMHCFEQTTAKASDMATQTSHHAESLARGNQDLGSLVNTIETELLGTSNAA